MPSDGGKGPNDGAGRGAGEEPRYQARFSDGQTAASHIVTVAFQKNALLIENIPTTSGSHGAVKTWPLRRIETGEPLTRRSVDVLIHEPGRAGATLFVADADFVQRLGEEARHLNASSQRWRAVVPFAVLTVIVAALIGLLAMIEYSPARTVAGMIPRPTRALLGDQVVKTVVGVSDVCSAPEGVAALNRLTNRLSAGAAAGRTFDVIVVDKPAVNAFAAPGEKIVLFRGAIKEAGGPDEVAGILAHEMGHGIALHPEAGLVRGLSLAVVGELILGGTAGGSIANLGLVLANLSYSRNAEREADRHALSILKAADVSAVGLAQFFERMVKREQALGGERKSRSTAGFDLLRTHPNTAERLERVRVVAGSYQGHPALDAKEWAALKQICGRDAGGEPKPSTPDDSAKRPDASKPAPSSKVPRDSYNNGQRI